MTTRYPTTRFSVHGVHIAVGSNNEPFLAFVKGYFGAFPEPSTETDHIVVSCVFERGYTYRVDHARGAKTPITLGTGAGYDEREVELEIAYREIMGTIRFSDTPWIADIVFKKNFFRHAANQLLFSGRGMSHYYRFLARSIVQNLLFMKLKRDRNIDVLSAAAAVVGGKALIFAGLPGSGKSTLVTALHAKARATVLAHNFVLTDGVTVYAYPESAVKLDRLEYPAAAIFVVRHGTSFAATRLSEEESARTLTAVNAYTAELPIQSLLGAALVGDSRFGYMADIAAVHSLAAAIPSYALTADAGATATVDYLRTQYAEQRSS